MCSVPAGHLLLGRWARRWDRALPGRKGPLAPLRTRLAHLRRQSPGATRALQHETSVFTGAEPSPGITRSFYLIELWIPLQLFANTTYQAELTPREA